MLALSRWSRGLSNQITRAQAPIGSIAWMKVSDTTDFYTESLEALQSGGLTMGVCVQLNKISNTVQRNVLYAYAKSLQDARRALYAYE